MLRVDGGGGGGGTEIEEEDDSTQIDDDFEQDQESSVSLGGTGAVTTPYAEDDSELYRDDNTDDIIDSGDPVDEDDGPTGASDLGEEARMEYTASSGMEDDGSTGAADIEEEARTDLMTGDGDDEMSWTEDNDEYEDDLPAPEDIDYDLDGEPGGDLTDGPGWAEPDYDGDGEPGGNLTDRELPDVGLEDIGLDIPSWLPIAVGGTVATAIAGVLAYVFGQLFNINIGGN